MAGRAGRHRFCQCDRRVRGGGEDGHREEKVRKMRERAVCGRTFRALRRGWFGQGAAAELPVRAFSTSRTPPPREAGARPDNGGRPIAKTTLFKVLGPSVFAASSALALRSKPGRSVFASPSAAGPYGFHVLSEDGGRLEGASSALAKANVACDRGAQAPARVAATSSAVEPRINRIPEPRGAARRPVGRVRRLICRQNARAHQPKTGVPTLS